MVRPEAQDGEGPAVFAQQQSDLIVVRVRVQRLVVLLVLHLVLRGLPALPRVAGLRGARLCGALLPPLGASVLKPHLNTPGERRVECYCLSVMNELVFLDILFTDTKTEGSEMKILPDFISA